jgi:hypothetical protein
VLQKSPATANRALEKSLMDAPVAGFRARNASASARVPVRFQNPTNLSAQCGLPHAPCTWQLEHGCFPVQCRVARTANGQQSVAPLAPGMYDLQGAQYVDRASVVTITCDTGFRATVPRNFTWASLHNASLDYAIDDIYNDSSAARVHVSCSAANCSCSPDGE